jgi:hypothetical protein
VAALANLSGAHLDQLVHGEGRLRGRTALRVIEGGSKRSTALGIGPAVAVDPLASLDLDFGDAPIVLLAGEAMPEARANVYARLIAGGAVDALAPLPDESAVAFLNRSVATVDAGAAFSVQFGQQDAYNMETASDLGPERLVVSFEANTDRLMHCDISAFDTAVCAHDPALAGVLIREIEVNAGALNAIGPSYAWDLARIGSFYDDFGMWWEELRSEVEYEKREALGKKAKKATVVVSDAEVRKHIRESGIRTPAAIRSSLGRHYCMPRGLKRGEVEQRLQALPKRARIGALAVYEIGKRMKRASRALDRVVTETERHVIGDLSNFTHPALIMDASHGEESAVYEIIDERYQHDSQDSGWGPGFALVLDDSAASVTRFKRALRALKDLSSAAQALCEAMRGFSILATEAE